MNINDTEAMMGVLSKAGHEIAASEEEADAVIVNTCAVRAKSEDKLYGKLGQLKAVKKRKKRLLVGVCGCVAEKNALELLTHKEVDFVFGTRAITRVDELLGRAESGERFIEMGDFIDELDSDTPRIRTSMHHAWITIIFGCNKFCSYCIVPYTRGREKSRNMNDILSEARGLAENGYREITYLGQNVDSYGKDLEDGSSLAKLIRETTEINGIERIWFLTSYPRDFSDELIDVIASSEKVSRAIHLPVQSGSNRVLKDMNRGYTREYYLDLIGRVKNKIKGASLSTDLIIGFPGETEKEYEETVSLVKEVRFERVNLAMYSPREGTLSAKKMEDDVPPEVKTKRLNDLLAIQKHINREENEKYLDRIIDVIPSSDKVSRAIHLPVQSGSNRVLKDMNRGYTREYYLDLIGRVKNRIQGATLSTDLIIGFPGETDEEYEETVSLVKEVRFERVNLAMYSPREGTLSAKKMKDDVPPEVKTKRLNDLLAIQKHINREENEKYLNETIDVIGEGKVKGNGKIYGRTINNKIVIYEAEPDLIGQPVKIRIERVSAGPLYGVMVK